MAEPTSSVPPFIPGLLIVGLLIIISIIIGWRNYVRRGDRRPGAGGWGFWEEVGAREGASRPERPKLWEVGVAVTEKHEKGGDEWERIMPLSATSLTVEPVNSSSDAEPLRPSITSSSGLNSRIARLNFLSSSPPRASSPPLIPPHRLQVSVLISMPSPRPTRPHKTQTNPDAKSEKSEVSSEDHGGRPSLAETWRPSTSSSMWTEEPPADKYEPEGSAEIALGVTVLPWRKDEEEDESLEEMGPPVT